MTLVPTSGGLIRRADRGLGARFGTPPPKSQRNRINAVVLESKVAVAKRAGGGLAEGAGVSPGGC